MRRARGGVFPAALLLLVWVFAPAAALEVGQRGTLRTVVRGDVPIDVPVVYLGLLENAAGPGYDIHLVELEGPVGEQVGVASGMSGSPVYFDGRPLGALAYRFGAIPRRPVGGVTPLATMRDAERSAATRPVAEDGALRAIATPVAAPGLLPVTRRFLAPRLEPLGLQLVAGAASGSSGDASSAVAEDARLVPGGPVGVQLVRGDLDVAATGTVTAIDGDRVLAFGHPFLGGGRTSLPMTTARVVHTLADMVGSFRMTRIGDEVGAIVEDRLAAIVGRTDRRAATIPVELTLDGRLDRAETYRFEVSRHPTLSPLMTATALLNALSADNGAELASTVRFTGEL